MAVVFSDALVLQIDTTPELSGKFARIAWDKEEPLTTQASSEVFPAYRKESANNELTYSAWKPLTGDDEFWGVIFQEAKTINYCGIAAHTLADVGASVKVQYFDEGWIDIAGAEVLPTDNRPILFLFEDILDSSFRILISGGNEAPRIGVIQFGRTLTMQRGIYGGHTPITLSRDTVVRPNVSEAGQWLGRSIVRAGSSTEFSWQHLTAPWYRQNFEPFVEHARTKPFFIAWRPSQYPDEVGYVWTEQDIKPSNMGIINFMDVSMTVRGLAVD